MASNPGPPILPLYAFSPDSEIGIAPVSAPLVNLGLISPDTNPGPPTLPLYAFAGSTGQEMDSLAVNISTVPIPNSLVLLASGTLMLLRFRRRTCSL